MFYTRVFLLFILLFSSSWLGAQSVTVQDTSIIQSLEKDEPGKGKIRVSQPQQLNNRVARQQSQGITNQQRVVIQGYRIQVFSDNNQRTAKNEAMRKEQMVQELFPELDTYVIFTAPFWRLRTGDFRTLEEANSKLKELQTQFPKFAREMRVVKDQVRIK